MFGRRPGSCLRATSYVAWVLACLLFGAGALSSGQPPQRIFSERVLGALRTNDPKYLERHFPNVQDFLDVMPGKFLEKVQSDEVAVSRHLEEQRDRFVNSMIFLRFETLVEPAFKWEYAEFVKTDRRPKPNPRFAAGVKSFDMFLTFSSGEKMLHVAVYDCIERDDRIVIFGGIAIVSAEEVEIQPESVSSVDRSVDEEYEDAIADFERVEDRKDKRDRALHRALEAIYLRAEEYAGTVKTRLRGQGNLEVFLLDLYAPATRLLRRASWLSEDEISRLLLGVDRQRLMRTEAVADDRAVWGEEADAGDLLEIVRWAVDPGEVAWRSSIDGKIIQYRERAVEKVLSELLELGRTQLEEGKLLDAIETLGNARQGRIPPGYDALSLHKRAPTRLEEIVSEWSLQADPLLEKAVRGYFA